MAGRCAATARSTAAGARALRLRHGRALGEVAGRLVERQLVDPEIGAGELAELVDRRAAVDEVLHHLPGHGRGIGGDATRGDPVIAGEDGRVGPFELGRVAALPSGEPGRQLFQPAERAGRLGQLRLALGRLGPGRQVRSRQLAQQGADFIEAGGRGLRRHCASKSRSEMGGSRSPEHLLGAATVL
jgi:hypothetical protein